MHFADGAIPTDYLGYVRRKHLWIVGGTGFLFILLIFSISIGAVSIPPYDVFLTIVNGIIDWVNWALHLGVPHIGTTSAKWDAIIWNIRLPQALAAIAAGVGLSVAGVAMQSILRNPLGSPFTLGISNAGAFGAAVSVIILGTGTDAVDGRERRHHQQSLPDDAGSVLLLPPCDRGDPAHLEGTGGVAGGDGARGSRALLALYRRHDVPPGTSPAMPSSLRSSSGRSATSAVSTGKNSGS